MAYMPRTLLVCAVAVLAFSSVCFLWASGSITSEVAAPGVQDEASLIQKEVALHRVTETEVQKASAVEEQMPGMEVMKGFGTVSTQLGSLPSDFTPDWKMPGQTGAGDRPGLTSVLVPQGSNKKYREANEKALEKKYGADAKDVYAAQNDVKDAFRTGGPLGGMIAMNKNLREAAEEADRRQNEFLSYADGYGEDASEQKLRQIRFEEGIAKAVREAFHLRELPGSRIEVVMKQNHKTMEEYPTEFVKQVNAELAEEVGQAEYERYLAQATQKFEQQEAHRNAKSARDQALQSIQKLTSRRQDLFIKAEQSRKAGDEETAKKLEGESQALQNRITALTAENKKRLEAQAKEKAEAEASARPVKLQSNTDATEKNIQKKATIQKKEASEDSEETDENGSSRASLTFGALALLLMLRL
eukprot:gnl/TRDRNA2_/TRDRNA2_172465_c0_seq1.p1 gnl/TRDRNA2_/TRDRNA2_172465_c0~~gnl/TRDRNA2_/TRDRNA2_172465_c0_seq1.p1  ORF type:complete len:416 (-),score=112.74 gnl/TRDRNA2_/TRDRNA2_172465_c0_seq1:52-1299(-)